MEARLEAVDSGLSPATEGWFVVNVRDAAWWANDHFGGVCSFEGDAHPFPELGFKLAVLLPGQPRGLYHAESNQEDFLVLAGECLLLVEGEERPLHRWDFVHFPPGTAHIVVGAGHEPCVVLMTGGRTAERSIEYPESELARTHNAAVERETDSADEAYATFPDWSTRRPAGWDDLPWG
jgi:uncharacterized cupin superfamily protein